MFLAELIASSFLDLISKRARPECRCKRVLVVKRKKKRLDQSQTKVIFRKGTLQIAYCQLNETPLPQNVSTKSEMY